MKFILLALLIISSTCFAAQPSPFDPLVILSGGDMSQATVKSSPVDLTQVINYSIQATWTGSPVGTINLQVSNLLTDCSLIADAGWVDYSNASFAVSGAGNFLWNVVTGNYHCVRIKYVKTSGTGALSEIYGRK